MYYIVTFFFVDSESMLESMTRPTENVVTNWTLIGICVSVGVLFGVICVVIIILIIILIIKRGTLSSVHVGTLI